MRVFDFLPIYKRELRSYLQSPSTYVVLALFFLICGVIFRDLLVLFSGASMASMQGGIFGQMSQAPNVTEVVIRQIFNIMTSLIMFTIPMLSMRLVAEEKNKGTFELLVSYPIGDWSILLGKYFAIVSIGVIICFLGRMYPLIVWWAGRASGSSPEWPIVISCAIALILIFSTYAAFGLMASAFTDSQMTAAIITLIGLILWQIVGAFQMDQYPWLRDVTQELSAYPHTENFIKGVLMLKDIAFFVLASFLFLFIASKTLDARRWRV